MEKHLIITGASNVSWKDAIVKAIDEASKIAYFPLRRLTKVLITRGFQLHLCLK